MKKKFCLLLFVGFFMFAKVFSQDTILLTNGKYKIGEVVEVNEDVTFYYKLNKSKSKVIQTESIYQIYFQDSVKATVYKKNIEEGFLFTEAEMHNYIIGRQDSRKNYKAPWITVGGIISGVAGGIGFIPPAYGLLAPTLYIGAINTANLKLKAKMVENKHLINDDFFVSGYKNSASRKRLKNALIGGSIGFSVAVGVVMILVN